MAEFKAVNIYEADSDDYAEALEEISQQAERITELEGKKQLLRITIAEALEECIGDDIEKATIILEQALKDNGKDS